MIRETSRSHLATSYVNISCTVPVPPASVPVATNTVPTVLALAPTDVNVLLAPPSFKVRTLYFLPITRALEFTTTGTSLPELLVVLYHNVQLPTAVTEVPDKGPVVGVVDAVGVVVLTTAISCCTVTHCVSLDGTLLLPK